MESSKERQTTLPRLYFLLFTLYFLARRRFRRLMAGYPAFNRQVWVQFPPGAFSQRVAKLGIARASGARDRRFKSFRADLLSDSLICVGSVTVTQQTVTLPADRPLGVRIPPYALRKSRNRAVEQLNSGSVDGEPPKSNDPLRSTVLLIYCSSHAPAVPKAERPPPNRETTGSIPVRRAYVEFRGCGRPARHGSAKPKHTGSIPVILFDFDGGRSSSGQSTGL